MKNYWLITFIAFISGVATTHAEETTTLTKPDAFASQPIEGRGVVSRTSYAEQLHGFWLGQSIANWTGLITEMVKVEPPFYTDEDWGKPADRAIWGQYAPHAGVLDFFFAKEGQVWGADDDTDIEYMYQHLLDTHKTCVLNGDQIRDGWLKHIYSNEDAPLSAIRFHRENSLWVSNEKAYYLMKYKGLRPPATSQPNHNELHTMIDAQLTTELFGLLAPARPEVALRMAHLPIRTTAKGDAEWIAEFYVIMHSLASAGDQNTSIKIRLERMAQSARTRLPSDSYAAKMYDFVKASYDTNPNKTDWESTRDAVYQRYQLTSHDGYIYQQPYDAGINYAASLVSLFYGEGDIKRTIQIGTLAGWDSDNPTATWGGLLGFMLGREGVEQAFGQNELSDAYWIHRTRRNFPDHIPDAPGEDTFSQMAQRALLIVDRVVVEEIKGTIDAENDRWLIPRGRGFAAAR